MISLVCKKGYLLVSCMILCSDGTQADCYVSNYFDYTTYDVLDKGLFYTRHIDWKLRLHDIQHAWYKLCIKIQGHSFDVRDDHHYITTNIRSSRQNPAYVLITLSRINNIVKTICDETCSTPKTVCTYLASRYVTLWSNLDWIRAHPPHVPRTSPPMALTMWNM